MCSLPDPKISEVLHETSRFLLIAESRRLIALLEALYKILPRQLPHLSIELEFEQRREYLGRRHFRLQPFHNFIDVRGFVCLEQRKDLAFVRGKLVGAWE